MSTYLPVFAQTADTATKSYEKVEVWERTDIVLASEVGYSDPYRDVEISATFTHTDGTAIDLYGFWNGGNEWRVRFAPTKVGVWSYEITCSNADDEGLNQSGKLLAIDNTGDTPLDAHGFVTISENGRYFTYADGTPFYWLGDTQRQALSYVSTTACNYPDCSCGNQFLHEVNDRVAKGFTVYQTYIDLSEKDGGGQSDALADLSIWSSEYDAINPSVFSTRLDYMFDVLAERGMTVVLGVGNYWQNTELIGEEDFARIARYITARYAAYPVIWVTGHMADADQQETIFGISADVVAAGDGYHHPQSAHQDIVDASNAYIETLDNKAWHDFYTLQSGHNTTVSKAYYESYWNNSRLASPKPYIETEANYEDVNIGSFSRYASARIAAWRANLLGSYGYTYGVAGIWANNYATDSNTGWYPTYHYEPWYMGLNKPASFE
ncbi:MAG: DUF4038 domain-containing protein, partial [Clostridia bacterium]|nr:DUF4038 domain-containing protein [Clostridia bacterium]